MKPHINIGTIGHTDGKASLTQAVTSAMCEETTGVVEKISIPSAEYEESPKPRKRSSVAGLLAMTSVLGAAYGMLPYLGGGRSSQDERNDPTRPKTDEDLKALDKAERKRERKRRAKELAKRKNYEKT